MINYGFTKEVNLSIDQLEEKVKDELKKEGFGVLTKIDIKEKFKEKLNIDFKEYRILGACNPPFAHKSILAEEDIGLFLPCNVIIYATDDPNISKLSIIKPTVAMSVVDNPDIKQIAETIENTLSKVLDNII